jgi:hypothetical protein
MFRKSANPWPILTIPVIFIYLMVEVPEAAKAGEEVLAVLEMSLSRFHRFA